MPKMEPAHKDSTFDSLNLDSMNENNNEKSIQDVEYNSNTAPEETSINQKRGTVSIDVTKALLLLGFPSWSSLEKGKLLEIYFNVNIV